MPERETIERARKDEREGKSPSTQAGEFVREEMEHIREGKHGARNTAKQAIAIGLSKARRAGVKLPPPKKGTTSERTRRQAKRELARGKSRKKPSRTRSRAAKRRLETVNRVPPHRIARFHARHISRAPSQQSGPFACGDESGTYPQTDSLGECGHGALSPGVCNHLHRTGRLHFNDGKLIENSENSFRWKSARSVRSQVSVVGLGCNNFGWRH